MPPRPHSLAKGREGRGRDRLTQAGMQVFPLFHHLRSVLLLTDEGNDPKGTSCWIGSQRRATTGKISARPKASLRSSSGVVDKRSFLQQHITYRRGASG